MDVRSFHETESGPEEADTLSGKIIMEDAFKGYTLDQDKIFPPEETVRRFRQRLRKVDLDILEET